MAIEISEREEIIEVVSRLFVYTDNQEWDKLQNEVFTTELLFDMASAGGGPAKTHKAEEICDMWKKGFEGIDAIHHQAGNFLVTKISSDQYHVYCYAIAIHYKKAAVNGNTREFVGSYDLNLTKAEGWRINSFKYNLKYIQGNLELK